jgi:predicted Ser/Thr protein kinase
MFPIADTCKGIYEVIPNNYVGLAAMVTSMPKKRDEDSGKYTETYPLSAFLSAIESFGGAAGTQEIADKVGCAYRTAHAKLVELEDSGEVTSRRVGNARLWSTTED